MLERYAKYKELDLDSPERGILRITLNKPETLNRQKKEPTKQKQKY